MMRLCGGRKRPLTACLVLTGCLVLTACLGPKTVMEYREHALRLEPGIREASGPLGWTVGVRPVTAGRAVDQRLVYVDAEGVVHRYRDDGWAEPPAAAVYRGLVDALRDSGAFADVGNAADMVRPDILVTGELRECAADFSADPPAGRVTLAVSARVYRDRLMALGRVITKSVPLTADTGEDNASRNEPLRAARALRGALQQAVMEAAELIIEEAAGWSARAASETVGETKR